MKRLLIIVVSLIFLGVVIFIIGELLPVKHVASQTKENAVDKATLWRAVRNFKEYPNWRSTVKKLEIISDSSWVEYSSDGEKITFGIIKESPSEKLVTKILDDDLPFGGEWTLELTGAGDSSSLKISERGEVYNPIYRFVGLFLDETTTMKQYQTDLEVYFKQSTQ